MKQPRPQQGFTLVAVIFLILVIGGALALLATLAIQSTDQGTQNLLQSRARYAALAGLEWGTQHLVAGDPATLCTGTLAGASVTVPAYPTISVSLLCQQRQYGNPAIVLYDLTARAEYGQLGAADYVWTEQNATLEFN